MYDHCSAQHHQICNIRIEIHTTDQVPHSNTILKLMARPPTLKRYFYTANKYTIFG